MVSVSAECLSRTFWLSEFSLRSQVNSDRSSISCILLAMLTSAVPGHLPRFSISRILLRVLCCHYLSFQILNHFLHLFDVFFSLRLFAFFNGFVDFFQFFVYFSSISLRKFLISSLRECIIFIKLF